MTLPGREIRCEVPPGVGARKQLRITVADLHGIAELSYAAPEVHDTTAVPTVGGAIIITGANFGHDPESLTLTLTLAGTTPTCNSNTNTKPNPRRHDPDLQH